MSKPKKEIIKCASRMVMDTFHDGAATFTMYFYDGIRGIRHTDAVTMEALRKFLNKRHKKRKKKAEDTDAVR